jgi:plasmid stabilization system protein ParE
MAPASPPHWRSPKGSGSPTLGVQLQASSFFERLTAREQIHTFASVYGVAVSVADNWLEQVVLEEKAGTRTEDLSGGQTQRLSVCEPGHCRAFPYLIFYLERDAYVDVWRVLHTRRDMPRLLPHSPDE